MDLFRVDWDDIMIHRKALATMKRNRKRLAEAMNNYVDSISLAMLQKITCEDVFNSSSNTKLSNTIYKQAVATAKPKLKFVKDLSKQDLLYFNIMDFSQRKEANPLLEIFKLNDYNRLKAEFTPKTPTSTYVGKLAKDFVNLVEKSAKKKNTVKALKKEVMRLHDTPSRKLKLWILKVFKLFYFTLTFSDYQNEDSYLYFVLSPILKHLLLNNDRTCLLFGESNMKSKAIEVDCYLDDEERRFAGPKIDVIVKDKKYDLEVMVVEVSGPPKKVNHIHFLEDRNKIAKNSKAMFKHIVSKMEVPSVTLIRKLNLYGIQFYNDQAIIYSLSKPGEYCYVFTKVFEFSALGESSTLVQSIPIFCKNFSALSYMIEETHSILDEMFSIDETQDILEESNEDPTSPHVSSRKKQKRRAEEE